MRNQVTLYVQRVASKALTQEQKQNGKDEQSTTFVLKYLVTAVDDLRSAVVSAHNPAHSCNSPSVYRARVQGRGRGSKGRFAWRAKHKRTPLLRGESACYQGPVTAEAPQPQVLQEPQEVLLAAADQGWSHVKDCTAKAATSPGGTHMQRERDREQDLLQATTSDIAFSFQPESIGKQSGEKSTCESNTGPTDLDVFKACISTCLHAFEEMLWLCPVSQHPRDKMHSRGALHARPKHMTSESTPLPPPCEQCPRASRCLQEAVRTAGAVQTRAAQDKDVDHNWQTEIQRQSVNVRALMADVGLEALEDDEREHHRELQRHYDFETDGQEEFFITADFCFTSPRSCSISPTFVETSSPHGWWDSERDAELNTVGGDREVGVTVGRGGSPAFLEAT